MSKQFLNKNEHLVYMNNTKPFPDVEGSTNIAKIINRSTIKGIKWVEIILLTDEKGERIDEKTVNNKNSVMILEESILSREIKDITVKKMYYFTSVIDKQNLIKATNFVIKKDINNPIESTSRTALGSGIYGIYINKKSDIPLYLLNKDQKVFEIECNNPIILQDKAHGESLTIASLHTNRYLDHIMQMIKIDSEIESNIKLLVNQNSIKNIVLLWNIFFYRIGFTIKRKWLKNILINYLIRYILQNRETLKILKNTQKSLSLKTFKNLEQLEALEADTLKDTDYLVDIQELPINDIMLALGFDSILANDSFNNNRLRGCVNYNYSIAQKLEGSKELY